MNKKTIYIVVAVIVVVLIVGVAGVMLLNNNGNNGTNPTPTPTPAPSATVVGASTVQFSVNETTNGAIVTYNFACKNFNTSTEVIRVDIPSSTGNYSYIINAGEQKSWSNTAGTWVKDSTFDSSFATAFTNYTHKLATAGNTNDLTYTTDTGSITIYCVTVNQSIAASVFATS